MKTPTQKALLRLNRARLQYPWEHDAELEMFEQRWIAGCIADCSREPLATTLSALKEALQKMITEERAAPDDAAEYVARRMKRDEFRVLVQEFAVDGLTEAQIFYCAMPRLPLAAQMPLLRILIDEFGSGNLRRAHTSLYLDLLRELEMPTLLSSYIEEVGPASDAFVNLFFWLTLRAEDPSYFAGALTYLETSIPSFFACYAAACERLGIASHAYYTEHQHIDGFHAMEGLRLLSAMHAEQALSPEKAHLGMRLASRITSAAFKAAVNKAIGKEDQQGECVDG